MKILLDYLPIALFVAAYYFRDIYFATLVLIVALFAQAGLLWLMTRKPPKMHLIAAVLALIFGGITLVLRDPTFIKLKPTVLYVLFAIVLIASQYLSDRSIIQRMMESSLNLPKPIWGRLNLIWAGFFLFCGVLNLYVAYSYPEETWVNFKLFGMLGLTLVFVLLQALYLSRHLHDEKP